MCFFLCTIPYVYLQIIMMILPLFISGAEIAFIIFILVMVFGADKIPEIARGLGQGLRSIKSATNDIKSEISKSAEKHGMDLDITKDIKKEVDQVNDNIDEITGPIKRRF